MKYLVHSVMLCSSFGSNRATSAEVNEGSVKVIVSNLQSDIFRFPYFLHSQAFSFLDLGGLPSEEHTKINTTFIKNWKCLALDEAGPPLSMKKKATFKQLHELKP